MRMRPTRAGNIGPWQQITASAVIVVLLGALGTACSTAPERAPSTSTATATAKVARAVDGFLESTPHSSRIRAILVEQDGHLVFEHYYQSTADDSRSVASVTKSFVFTLVGIALADGHLRSLDEPLSELLPERAPTMSPAVAGVTLRQLLTMTAGFGSPQQADMTVFVPADDPAGTILANPAGPPGREFAYSDGGAHLLSVILERALGGSLLDYARTTLFDPLDIPTRPAYEAPFDFSDTTAYKSADFAWPTDSAGNHLGFAHLKLRPCDMLRLGELYLNGGVWKGKRLVPAEWVAAATVRQVEEPGRTDGGYGYGWWIENADGAPGYSAMGFGGQVIEVVPERRLVVVVSTDFDLTNFTDYGIPGSDIAAFVDKEIAPALRDSTSTAATQSSP